MFELYLASVVTSFILQIVGWKIASGEVLIRHLIYSAGVSIVPILNLVASAFTAYQTIVWVSKTQSISKFLDKKLF